MLSMFSLVVVGLFISGTGNANAADAAVFRISVTYIYAGSLLLGGGFHLGVSRYISDRFYAGQMEDVLPCFMRSAAAILGISFLFSCFWFAFSGLNAVQAVSCIAMFQSLSIVWLCMVFLSAAKGYEQIVFGFIFGHSVGAVLALYGYSLAGVGYALAGYAAGQFILAFWLSLRVFREFPSYNPETDDILTALRKNWLLIGIGFAFNLGIWIDKIIIWYSPLGTKVIGWFHCAENYDTCLFFSYLTIVPAMALFLIRIETSFYRAYSVFFTAVVGGGDLDAIQDGKKKIMSSLWLSVTRLIKTQGAVSLCLVLAAPVIEPYLGIGIANIPTLRFALVAAFLQALLLFILIFFLYFDWHVGAMYLSLLFLMLNAFLTGISIMAGPQYLALGYLLAVLGALIAAIYLFNSGMEYLEFETFSKQSAIM
jgi:uncharacterized membrane protein